MRPFFSRGTPWINAASTDACCLRTDETPPVVARAQAPAVVVCSAAAAVKLTAVLAADQRRAPAYAARRPAPAAERAAAPAPVPTESEPPAPAAMPPENHEFDLIIEELPNHRLYQPIPVQMQPFGNEMFSASVPALTLSATGSSVSDALLLLKSQIESAYAEIERKSELDEVEKEHLKFYYAHIVKEPPPPEFVPVRASGPANGSKPPSRWAGRW